MNTIHADLFIRPLEPLFFGEPRPFNAGETHHAKSLFPPSPMTLQGIVRSQLLRAVSPPLDLDDWTKEEQAKRAALVGESDRLPEGWQFGGPLPATIENTPDGPALHPWAPAPRYLYRTSGQQRIVLGHILTSTQVTRNDLASDSDAGEKRTILYGPPPELQDTKPLTGWMDGTTLLRTLTGNRDPLPANGVNSLPPFLRNDQRQPGIALDRRSNTGLDGMLYLLEHLRFAPQSGLWGNFSGSVAERIGPDAFWGVGAAGRKGRLVSIEKPPPLVQAWRDLFTGHHLQGVTGATTLFWLYLLTPVRLEKEGRNSELLLPGGVRLRRADLPSGVILRCRAAHTGPPISLGGMDTAKGRSRPNRSYAPPGSAWLMEIETNNAALCREALQNLNNAHPLGDPEEARFGFGHTLVGIGPNEQGEQP